MATFNNWGSDLNEDNIGDIIYDSLEQKAKEEAKDAAKDGIEAGGKAASKALDKATDHIAPVKTIKDKVKEKLSNNPITRAKAAIRKLKEKAKEAVKKAARDGIKAVGRAVVKGVKALGKFIAKHPIASLIIFIVALLIFSYFEDAQLDVSSNATDSFQSDNPVLQSPIYVAMEGMTDEDIVVILMEDCINAASYGGTAEIDVDKEESAKFIYSIFRSYGFNNASIAGIIANIDIESGLDPSMIEGLLSEYGFIGPRKAEALLSMSDYTVNTLFPMYEASGTSISRDGYKTTDSSGHTVYYCGMGLAQWTGGNAGVMLSAAETLNMTWYSMDFQLAYMLCDCIYRPGFFSGWVGSQTDDDYGESTEGEAARAAGVYFAHEYEGNSAHDAERGEAAVQWYSIIKDWGDAEVDDVYVDSIVALATDLGGIIEFTDIHNARIRCLNGEMFNNSSLAAAAVSLAWPTQEQSYNNGTNLYQTVLSTIWPTNTTYKACDRVAAAAVRWSGTDDDFPFGTDNQITYMESSPKWEKVAMASDLTMDDLLPGDIFILSGHVFIYVGESTIQIAYGDEADAGSDSVSGSLNERSAACDGSSSSIMSRGGEDWENEEGVTRGIYAVYRCVQPDHSTTYTSIGSGMSN